MHSQQCKIIKESWNHVGELGIDAIRLFYQRLFETDREIATMFDQTNLEAQYAKLLHSLDAVVAKVDQLDELIPELEQLGKQHMRYGVKNSHYDSVGSALLWTLEKGLGSRWTPEVKDAWSGAYSTIASVMQSATIEANNHAQEKS